MAVVSPWCYAVLYSSPSMFYGHLPSQDFSLLLILERKTFFCFPLIWVHVKSSWPIYIGIHLCYNGMDNLLQSICFYFVLRAVLPSGSEWGAHKIETKRTKPIKKTFLSSDHTLQLGYVKPESLVIVD